MSLDQKTAIERLAKFIYVNPSESDDWFEARQLYVKVLSEQTAAFNTNARLGGSYGELTQCARDQVHAIIEMLETD